MVWVYKLFPQTQAVISPEEVYGSRAGEEEQVGGYNVELSNGLQDFAKPICHWGWISN